MKSIVVPSPCLPALLLKFDTSRSPGATIPPLGKPDGTTVNPYGFPSGAGVMTEEGTCRGSTGDFRAANAVPATRTPAIPMTPAKLLTALFIMPPKVTSVRTRLASLLGPLAFRESPSELLVEREGKK